MLQAGIRLHFTPALLPLKEQVLASTVHFSMIRMRNASCRQVTKSNSLI
ncbi:DUF6886 family protein [Paenibacillus lactis]